MQSIGKLRDITEWIRAWNQSCMGKFLSLGAKNSRSGQVGVMYGGQILIDTFCHCEVALSDAVGIVTG